jgi:hypothetical protein
MFTPNPSRHGGDEKGRHSGCKMSSGKKRQSTDSLASARKLRHVQQEPDNGQPSMSVTDDFTLQEPDSQCSTLTSGSSVSARSRRCSIKQVLLERKVLFTEGACLQKRHVRQAAAYNKGVIAAWEVDRENAQLIQQRLTLRQAAVIAAEARDLPCLATALAARCKGRRISQTRSQG